MFGLYIDLPGRTDYVVHIGSGKAAKLVRTGNASGDLSGHFNVEKIADDIQLFNEAIEKGFTDIKSSDPRPDFANLVKFVNERWPQKPKTVWERTGIKPLTVEDIEVYSTIIRQGIDTRYSATARYRNFTVHTRLQRTAGQAESDSVAEVIKMVEDLLTALLERGG